MDSLLVRTGKELIIDPRVVISRSDIGVVLAGGHKNLAVEVGADAAIEECDAHFLIKEGFALWKDSRLFSRPELASQVFAWNPEPEVEGIISRIQGLHCIERGLDVGCGFGRLLLSFLRRGLRVDGVDASLPLLLYVNSKLAPNSHDTCTLYRAPIESFAPIQRYDYAFSALNTIRYLERASSILSHLSSMHSAIKPNGIYLINVALTADAAVWSPQSWNSQIDGESHRITWSRYSYCHMKDQFVELIRIVRTNDECLIHEECEIQARVTAACLVEMARRSGWRFEALLSNSFEPLQVSNPPNGKYWVQLRRL